MKRLILSLFAASALALTASAGVAKVMINGSAVEKTPVALSFNDDKVTIHFGERDTMEANLDEVSISFADGSNLVNELSGANIFRFNGLVGDVLSISGIAPNAGVAIYDLSGKQVLAAQAKMQSAESLEINVAELPAGAYLLRVGNEVVKFIKR